MPRQKKPVPGQADGAATPPPTPPASDAYQRHKADAAQRSAKKSAEGRDIGSIPAVVNPERRARAENDFRFFCTTYFPAVFYLPWSADHVVITDKIVEVVTDGGSLALAMPRRFGKTTICKAAAFWAILTGRRRFVALIGATDPAAIEMIDFIKLHAETNQLLLEDFPEAIYPIRCLDGIVNRCKGQTHLGDRTHMVWKDGEIHFPTIPGSKASGAVVQVAGITGRIRGMNCTTAAGESIRPDLAVVDDPQTEESAASPTQVKYRERIMKSAIRNLAAPGVRLAAFCPCTVLMPDDLADRILDRDKHPYWQGERRKLVYEFPTNKEHWDKYRELWRESLKAGKGITLATEYYAANREEMDAGAVVAWPEQFLEGELSAIQSAMNLLIEDEESFWSEQQNQPKREAAAANELTLEQIAGKLSMRSRGIVPLNASRITAFTDVHQELLYWMVVAWSADFTGTILDYGTFPDQKRPHFTLARANPTLGMVFGEPGIEAAIQAGLESLVAELMERKFYREDDAEMQIGRLLIDENWVLSKPIVHEVVRRSKYARSIYPSIGLPDAQFSPGGGERKAKPGELTGPNWRIPSPDPGRRRGVRFKANSWKTFVFSRLASPRPTPGCLDLFGEDEEQHRLLAEHLKAEVRHHTQVRGGSSGDVWKPIPGRDNHWFDCLVGCAVAASIEGCEMVGTSPPAKKKQRPVYDYTTGSPTIRYA